LIEQMRTGQLPIDSEDCILMPLGFSEGQSLGPPPAELKPANGKDGHVHACGEDYPKNYGGALAVENN
jgi:hypothetical protein